MCGDPSVLQQRQPPGTLAPVRPEEGFLPNRSRSHRYFENLDPYAGAVKPGDPEFEAQARSRIGPEYQHLVDENNAAYLGPDDKALSLRGFYARDGADPTDHLRRVERSGGTIPAGVEGKQVFGVGSGATPVTWAHEFRHAEVDNEFANRMLDVIHAPSAQAYQQAVRAAHEWMGRNRQDDQTYTFAEKEAEILRRMPVYADAAYGTRRHVRQNQGEPILSDRLVDLLYPDRRNREQAAEPFLLWAGKDSAPPQGHHWGIPSRQNEVNPPRTKDTVR